MEASQGLKKLLRRAINKTPGNYPVSYQIRKILSARKFAIRNDQNIPSPILQTAKGTEEIKEESAPPLRNQLPANRPKKNPQI
jgi:hypothetical protein